MTIKVSDVVREMDIPSPEFTVYLNRNTGEFVGVSEHDIEALDDDLQDAPEWQREQLPKIREATESEAYVALPDSFDIHEWEIMQDFASSVSDAEASDALLRALHGKGAFRYFRDQLHRLGRDEEWFRFRQQAFERIAIDWLEANGIPYTTGQGDE